MSLRNFNTNITKAKREQIGVIIKGWRIKAGLTQEKAAFQIGISPTILRQMEKGRADFRIDTLLVIAIHYNESILIG